MGMAHTDWQVVEQVDSSPRCARTTAPHFHHGYHCCAPRVDRIDVGHNAHDGGA